MGIGQVTIPALASPEILVQFASGRPGFDPTAPFSGRDPRRRRGEAARRAVFVDRDGVLIRAVVRGGQPFPVKRADEVEVLDGATEACAALRQAGLLVVVVTNQPDVARGTATVAAVQAINDEIARTVEVDAFLSCLHDDADGCQCRKPRPGMLTYAADRWDVALTSSFIVGDRWRDIDAGQRCGCRTIFVDHGYDEQPPNSPDLTVTGLAGATSWILDRCVP